jgi:DNA helicase-2/ATP-dependent DNA helicase PcrA
VPVRARPIRWRIGVAHLIVNGADPRRILLMTFSAPRALRDGRRVERIARKVLGDNAGVMTDALTWAGTFHGIGARLLRTMPSRSASIPDFTIHDREDSADLMNLVRHELGFSKTESAFPTKGTCLAIYSRCVNARRRSNEVLRRPPIPGARPGSRAARTVRRLCRSQAAQNVLDYDDLLLYWAQMVGDADLWPPISARASTTCWSTNIRTPTGCNLDPAGAEARTGAA